MSALRHRLVHHSKLLQATYRSPKHAKSRIPIYNTLNDAQVRLQSSSAFSHDTAGKIGWLYRDSNVRVSTLLAVLLAFGVGATALGLYEFYTSFTLWPVELRKDLRAGIRTKNQGDFALSERFLGRAYETALALPLSVLGADPYLKLSGIGAILAEVAPERRAKEILQNVWDMGDPSLSRSISAPTSSDSQSAVACDNAWSSYRLTDEERLRRVAIACKLAELNEGTKEEEKWLVWAVEEVLRLAGLSAEMGINPNTGLRVGGGASTVQGKVNDELENTSKSVLLAELELPTWMRKDDLGAPLAALGTAYARKGKIDYAIPLYLQAISLLLPAGMEGASIDDRCQAAQLMNNLSELIMRRPPTPEIRHQAEAWAGQARGVIERARAIPLPRKGWFSLGDEPSREVCDQVLGVVLFNLGMLREMDDDHAAARSLYEQSAKQCKEVGLREGVMQANQALRRVRHADSPSEPKS